MTKELTIAQSNDMRDLLQLPKHKFVAVNLRWIKEENDGKLMDVEPSECPLAIWVAYNDAKCSNELVANIASCPLCGAPMCPECGNHVVDQVSRVTGYLSSVSGWNEAKTQEFADRTRYEVAGR